MARVFLGLGSNVGDRLEHMREAVRLLSNHISILQVGPVFETKAMYVSDQPPFLNSALAAESMLPPLALLRLLKDTEAQVGRTGGVRYGPREIDIDLLAYGSLAYSFDAEGVRRLEIPHPKTAERRFVLAPLAAINPGFVLPKLGMVADLLAGTEGQADEVQQLSECLA